jgi:hypothetical protein
MGHRRALTATAAVAAALVVGAGGTAAADVQDDLAQRYAPVTRLVDQPEECGPGEPYRPSDVEAFMGEPTVALRGPWTTNDLVGIAPTAEDLGEGLYEHHLDFPGDPLQPGCDYERWAREVSQDTSPTTYAHIVTQAGHTDRVALQYWFFYPFNDYNNKHEGDWEMVQLLFAARTVEQALRTDPLEITYSQHEGAEASSWDDPKLERVDGTHPVVHVAAGSHANYFDEALFLGRSGEQGVGCDDTRGPTVDVRPDVALVPSDAEAARQEFPWTGFRGRWGERQEAFYNGPTGPNMKAQWTEPVTYSEEKGRDQSYAVPVGGLLGTETTDFFCGAVEAGSDLLRRLVREPVPAFLALVAVVGLLVYGAARTTWRPTAPLRASRRRAWGQTVAASVRMYGSRPWLFLGIGVVMLPVSVAVAAVQASVVRAPTLVGISPGGEDGGFRVALAAVVGLVLGLLGLALVQSAATLALAEVDAGRDVGVVGAYRLALGRLGTLLVTLVVVIAAVSAFSLSVLLIPLGLWLAVRWGLVVPVASLEAGSPSAVLQRSGSLAAHRPWRLAALLLANAALLVLAGPVLGTLLVLLTSAPLELLNVVAGLTFTVLAPFTALVLSYAYYDALVHERLAGPAGAPRDLPAEA